MDIGFSSHNITLHAVSDLGRILNKGLVRETLKPGSGYILIFERKVDQDVIGFAVTSISGRSRIGGNTFSSKAAQ